MRGKLMFLSGLAAGFVLGTRAGREKYEEIVVNAKKVWEHPTVQEAAGVAQAQATKLYGEGKDKLNQSRLGEKLSASRGQSRLSPTTPTTTSTPPSTMPSTAPSDEILAGSSTSSSPRVTPSSSNSTSY